MRGSKWSSVEDELIQNHYPTMDLDKLVKLLPGRTKNGVICRASQLHVKRSNFYIKQSLKKNEVDDHPIMVGFYKYLRQAIEIIKNTGCKPDVDCMIRTYREIYGRETSKRIG